MKIISLILFLSACSATIAQHRLMSYNIRNAKGMDNLTDYNRVATVIKNARPDIAALQELDSATKRSGQQFVLKTIADKTRLHYLFGAAISYQGGKYGVGILSRKRSVRHYTIALPGREEERVLLVAEFKKYVIFCTHWSLTAADRLSSAAIINKEAAKFSKPVFLLGDLNTEPGSAAIVALQQKWTLLSGEAFTFPAGKPDRCIDYIFSLHPVSVRAASVLEEAMASDHRPVIVDLGAKN